MPSAVPGADSCTDLVYLFWGVNFCWSWERAVSHPRGLEWGGGPGNLSVQNAFTWILHSLAVSSFSIILSQFQGFVLPPATWKGSAVQIRMVLSSPHCQLGSGFWSNFKSSQVSYAKQLSRFQFLKLYYCPLSLLFVCFSVSLCPFVPLL